MQIKGIDLSHFQTDQGPIGFSAVRRSGIDFVMVRAGWCGYEGELHFDANLDQTITNAVDAGVCVGLYVYSFALSAEAAMRAAQETAQFAGRYRIEYPIALDVEDVRLIGVLSREQITGIVRSFCDTLLANGYYPMFHTTRSFADQYLDLDSLAHFAFWLAETETQCPAEGICGMWQSGGGTCPGVQGKCGQDLSFVHYAQRIREAGLNGGKPTKKSARSVEESTLKSSGITTKKFLRQGVFIRLGRVITQGISKLRHIFTASGDSES